MLPQNPNSLPGAIIQAGSGASITITARRRDVVVCTVFDHELESIGSANSKVSLDVGLLGLSFGSLVSFGITLVTVEVANVYAFAAFVCLTALFGLATIFFAFRFYISRNESQNQIAR